MKKTVRNWLTALLLTTGFGGMVVSTALPQPVYAACNDRLFTFPAWYKGLVKDDCNIKSPNDVGGLPTFIWRIALNIIEVMLQLVGYIAVSYIIVGGFKYLTSTGSPDAIVRARKTILNAVIGLIISIFSVAIVNLVSGAI
jgi:hypothetical protein